VQLYCKFNCYIIGCCWQWYFIFFRSL